MAVGKDIRPAYHQQLDRLSDDLIAMGSMVDKAIERAGNALHSRDRDLAEKVIVDDRLIRDRRIHIEDATVRILATQHPMASDLRFVTSVERIATDLERMGDHARTVARLCLKLCVEPPLPPSDAFRQMEIICRARLRVALDAFLRRDHEQALACVAEDIVIDRLQDEVYSTMLARMETDSTTVIRANYSLWIAHNLERIGDHVTNICERVIFLAKGSVVS